MSYYHIVSFLLFTSLNTIQAQALENVAIGKTCSESSTYVEKNVGNDCSFAINNNTSTDFVFGAGGNCIHTAMDDRIPSWSVDLGQLYNIRKIVVFARVGPDAEDRRYRMKNVKVFVDGRAVYTFPVNKVPDAETVIGPTNSSLPIFGRNVLLFRAAYMLNGSEVNLGDVGYLLLNFCEVQVWADNVCAGDPCQHGGTCQAGEGDSYQCLCVAGYSGRNCSYNVDECASNPCANGGTCNDGIASYTCSCSRGYTGANCRTNIDDCVANACLNGGTCVDGVDSYTCTCSNGYTGPVCQINIDDCVPNPCSNNDSCSDGIASYTCTCPNGYTGKNCETNFDECSSNPCQHGGTCTDAIASYTCTCLAGYTGLNCQTEPSPQTAAGPIVGAFLGGMVLNACLMILGFCIWKRRGIASKNKAVQKVNNASDVLYHQGPENLKEKTFSESKPESRNGENRTSIDEAAYYVNVDNTYDKLHPNVNNGEPERDAYTELQIKKKSKHMS